MIESPPLNSHSVALLTFGQTWSAGVSRAQSASSFWGNTFLAERTAKGLVRIAIVATVTVGGMDAAVEPIGIYSRRVTGETVAMYITQYPI